MRGATVSGISKQLHAICNATSCRCVVRGVDTDSVRDERITRQVEAKDRKRIQEEEWLDVGGYFPAEG